jgi:hypothetical protein
MPERFAVSYEKVGDFDYPVLTLTGTDAEIEADLAVFLTRHPELNSENFVVYKRVPLY